MVLNIGIIEPLGKKIQPEDPLNLHLGIPMDFVGAKKGCLGLKKGTLGCLDFTVHQKDPFVKFKNLFIHLIHHP